MQNNISGDSKGLNEALIQEVPYSISKNLKNIPLMAALTHGSSLIGYVKWINSLTTTIGLRIRE